MYYKTKKILFFFIILPLSYLLLFELMLRVAIFLFTFNSGILIYGINKNISLSLHSISKGQFYIVNSTKLINRQVTKKNDVKDQIWIFGGSTSNRGFCDSKNLSWVDFLSTKLVKKNFSRNGINSNFSINLIKNEFGRKKIVEGDANLMFLNKPLQRRAVDKNPSVLAGYFETKKSGELKFATKIKMAETSDLVALVKAGDNYFMNTNTYGTDVPGSYRLENLILGPQLTLPDPTL